MKKEISDGVAHTVPSDLNKVLIGSLPALMAWEDITPLARNEWLCFIESAKKAETRNKRIEWAKISLVNGKRRPCCWAGCTHRQKNKTI